MTRVSPPCVVSVLPVWLWRGVPSTHYRPGGLTFFENWRATIPRTGGQPSRELANTHVRPCLGGGRFFFGLAFFVRKATPENWRATIPRTGGQPSRELAGNHPENWRSAIPRIDGQPARRVGKQDVRENARCVDASQLAKALGGIEMARVSPPCAFRFCLYGFGGECRPRVSAPGGRHCYYNNVSDGIIANLVMVPLSPQRGKT